MIPLEDFPPVSFLDNLINSQSLPGNDKKRWKLTSNKKFSIKTIYNFLNDGGIRCHKMHTILKGGYHKKISLFNWLAWENKILTLDNLALRRCNFLQISTCVMCYADIETSDHLLLHCLWLLLSKTTLVESLEVRIPPSPRGVLRISGAIGDGMLLNLCYPLEFTS